MCHAHVFIHTLLRCVLHSQSCTVTACNQLLVNGAEVQAGGRQRGVPPPARQGRHAPLIAPLAGRTTSPNPSPPTVLPPARLGAPGASPPRAMELEGRWRDLDYLLTRQGNVVGPGFEPGPEIREFLQDGCR